MGATLNLGTDGNWATKEDSLLAYNSENGNFKPLPFDFTRASNATVVNKAGLIETVGSGEPRIDFSNDAKGALLLEPTRSNEITYSQDFTNADWTKTRVDITTENILNPRGVNSSFKITSNNTSESFIQQPPSSVSGANQTFSFFIKKGNTDFCHITLFDGGSNGFRQWINLNDFTLGSNLVFGSGFTLDNTSIENYGNGWYRVLMVINNSGSTVFSRINISNTDGNNSSSIGSYIYVDMVQFENSSYATSYIPTQGSAVTRVADVCNNGGNEQVINSTEGVLEVNISALFNDLTRRAIVISDGTTTNRVFFRYNSVSQQIQFFVIVGGNAVYAYTETLTDQTDYAVFKLKWSASDFGLKIDGVEVDAQASGVSFSANTLTTMNFYETVGVYNFYGNIKYIKVYSGIGNY